VESFSEIEKSYLAKYRLIAGVDESGRGPLAGPVVAAAVIFPPAVNIPGIRDSKLTNEKERDVLSQWIKEAAISWGTAEVSAREIDRINILEASRRAMMLAVEKLNPQPKLCLVDGWKIPHWEMLHYGVIKGDALYFSIASASILAKHSRDAIMLELAEKYPAYGFARHKGYPTPEHRQALEQYGPSPIHRLSFRLIPQETLPKKLKFRRLGIEAEEAAVNYLQQKGYQIIVRNYRGDRCEIDIIAEQSETLVFIEVKSSQTVIDPETEVDIKKIGHIIRAAEAFLINYAIPVKEIRFDIVALRFEDNYWQINHIQDAFRP